MAVASLLAPYSLGDLLLKNRVVLAPMTRARAGEGRIPNALMAQYYTQRASAGLILSEATTVSSQGNGWNHSPGMYSDAMTEGWKGVTSAVHAQGGRIFMQMWHCGRASHSAFHGGKPAVAPSAIPIQGDHIHTPAGKQPYETPRALETSEVEQTVQDYRQAAERAKQAGFDGLEIHGANGYLIDTFLQSKTNQRTDKYGGSIEKRFTFLQEIVQAVTEVFPASRVGVRISPNGVFNDMGSADYREQFLYVAQQLAGYSLAYLHIMDGLAFGFHGLGEPMNLSEFRKVYKGTIIGNCGYNQQTAEAAIESGNANLIAIGRPYISNPDLVERYAHGWPLAADAPMSDWYMDIGAKGYTDYPAYSAGQ